MGTWVWQWAWCDEDGTYSNSVLLHNVEEAHFVPSISPIVYQISCLLNSVSLYRILTPVLLAGREQFPPYLILSSVIDSSLPALKSSPNCNLIP